MKANAWTVAGVGILFLALSVAMLYPLSFQLATHARDAGDPLLNTWILAWVTRTLFLDPINLYHGNIFYPFPYSLTFSEILVGSLPITAPVIWLTGNPLLAHNILMLLSFALSGLGAYLLTDYLTRSRAAGIVAGVIYAFAPYRFAQLGHVQILTAQGFPFAILFCFLILRRRSWIAFFGFASAFVLQALSSFYYGLFLAVAMAIFALYVALFERGEVTRALIVRSAITCTAIAVVILPFALSYFKSQQFYGFTRALVEVQDLSASLTDYLVAPPSNLLYGTLTAPLTSQSKWPGEHYLFTGVVPVALAVTGLFVWRGRARQDRWPHCRVAACRSQAFFLLLGGLSIILSFGPELRFGDGPTRVPLPYLILYHFVPGFKGLRVPARFDVLVMLALAVLAGYGIARLVGYWQRCGAGGARQAGVAAAASAVILVEFASLPVRAVPVETGDQVPAVYRWLAGQPIEIPVMELPADDPADNFWYEYFSVYHWRRIVNGHSGFVPEDFWITVDQTRDFPSKGAIDRLRFIGVGLVIVHADRYAPDRAADVLAGAAQSPDLELIRQFGEDSVYRVLPPSRALSRTAGIRP